MKYVWAAYTVVFLAIYLYTLVLGRRQTRLEESLEMLKNDLEKETR